jgi:hypothetical protein
MSQPGSLGIAKLEAVTDEIKRILKEEQQKGQTS